jgi:hypothetical protein
MGTLAHGGLGKGNLNQNSTERRGFETLIME